MPRSSDQPSRVLSSETMDTRLRSMSLKDTLTPNQASQLQKLMRKEPMACDPVTGDMAELVRMGLARKDQNGRYRVSWDRIPRPGEQPKHLLLQ